MKDMSEKRFKINHLPRLIMKTYKAWEKDKPFRLSAIVAYYAVLSLPGLLIIIINLVGSVWGTEIVQGQLTDEISRALGSDAAKSIQTMLAETQNNTKNTLATILGVCTIIFGATGVFYHLQLSLNHIWEVKVKDDLSILKMFIRRLRSFAFILAIGFLLLISFIVTTAIAALTTYIKSLFPDLVVYIVYGLDAILSVGIITVLFALMFKYLPDAKIKWKAVWVGAIITAILFVLGKSLLGFYFGEADPGSTYGAAGTVVLILLWVSYSCLILFFGAEFTWVYANTYGYNIKKKLKTIA